LESLPVPFEIRQSLELRARKMITEIVSKEALNASSTCVYTPIYPSARVTQIPQIFERWFRWNPSSEDSFDVYISKLDLYPLNEMKVGLALGPSVPWEKSISAWHYFPTKQRGNTITNWGRGTTTLMQLRKADCFGGAHTIILRKPKFLGVMTDMYTFTDVHFWSLFNRREVIFKWVKH
jgi:hypothetical protein